MQKDRLVIKNRRGELIFSYEEPPIDCFDDVNLQDADMRGLELAGIWIERGNMTRADLRGTILYSGVLIHVNLEGANLEGANLQGSNINFVNFRNANLRNADLGPDVRGD